MVMWWAFFYLAGSLSRFDNNCFIWLQGAVFVLYCLSLNLSGSEGGGQRAAGFHLRSEELFLLTSVTSILFYSSAAETLILNSTVTSNGPPGEFLGVAAGKLLSITSRAREYFIRELSGRQLTRLCSALGKAMLIADRESLPGALRDDYIYLGIAHLLALSGLHLGIVIFPLKYILHSAGLKRWAAGLITSLAAISYCAMAGFPPSLIRAASLFIAAFFLRTLNTRADLTESLITGGLAILLISPVVIRNAGFQLSFMAVAGISVLGLPAMRYLKKCWGERKMFKLITAVASPLIITVAVNLFIMPILLNLYGRCPLISPVVNLAMIIPFTMFLYSGILYLAAPFEIIRNIASHSANFSAILLRWIPRKFSSRYYPAIMRDDIQTVIYAAAILLLAAALSGRMKRRKQIVLAAFLIGLLSIAYPRLSRNHGEMNYIYTDFGDPDWAENCRYSSAAGGIITLREGISRYQASRLIRKLCSENIGKVETIIICSSEYAGAEGISCLRERLGVRRIVCSEFLHLAGSSYISPELDESCRVIAVSRGNKISFQNIELEMLNPEFPPAAGSVLDSRQAFLRYNLIIDR